MTATLPPMIRFQPLVAGEPIPGGKVYFYISGTTTPQNVYADDGTTSLGNNLTLDANGATDFRLGTGLTYKIDLKTAAGASVTGWPINKIVGSDGVLISLADPSDVGFGDALVAVHQPWTGAKDRTQHDKNQDYPTGNDFTGVDPTGTADSTAGINAAIAGLVAAGRYKLILPSGTYKIAAADASTPCFDMPDGFTLEGDGIKTKFLRTDTHNVATFLLNTARVTLRDFSIYGSGSADPFTGYGVQIGDTTGSGIYTLQNIRYFNLFHGLRIRGAYWLNMYDCWFENNSYGTTFDATGSTNTTTVYTHGCTWRGNTRNGIVGLNVPVRNLGLSLINANVEENGSLDPATYPQVKTGAMGNFTILNGYYECMAATKPVMLDITGCGDFSIQNGYFAGASCHVYSSGAVSYGYLAGNRFLTTTGTNSVDLSAAPGTQVFGWANESDKPILMPTLSIAGDNCGSGNILGKITDTQAEDVAFPTAPDLQGGTTPGTPVYSIQVGRYSRVGNQVHFRIRLTTTGLGGAAGVAKIKNLPLTSANSTTCHAVVQVAGNGVTLSGGNTFYYGIINPNSSEIILTQDGSVTGATDMLCSQLAAATTLIISGTYTV